MAAASVYVDYFVALGGSKAAAEQAFGGFEAACRRRGLRLHECLRGVLRLEALPTFIDCRRGRIC